jgi:magnesium chelatase subunit D
MSGAAAWADALQALALFAADPIGLGGMSVRAGAGPVRDHFLALLHQHLPPQTPVRRVPLHVGDDRLLGGLDLAATLQAGKPVAQMGLLAEADGGIIILAMAERTEPATAARLRGALDDGVVTLQRDGLSRVLPTRFGVVALDEGAEPDEHTPVSLIDRMAFHLDLTRVSLSDATGLGTIHRTPMSFGPGASSRPNRTGDPAGDTINSTTDHAAGDATDDKSSDTAPDDGSEAFCVAAIALGIDSLRAPLLALRAARSAALKSGRDHVTEDDLGLAARLVLAPRATRFPPPPDDAFSPPPDDAASPEDPEPSPDSEPEAQQTLPDQPLADVVLDAAKAALPADLLAQLTQADDRGLSRTPGRAGQVKASLLRGRPIGTRRGEPRNGAPCTSPSAAPGR